MKKRKNIWANRKNRARAHPSSYYSMTKNVMCVHSKHINPENAPPKMSEHIACWKRSCKCSRNTNYSLSLAVAVALAPALSTATATTKMENLFKFFFLASARIICTSCTIVVLLALHSYSYQEHTIYILILILLCFFPFLPCRLHSIRCVAVVVSVSSFFLSLSHCWFYSHIGWWKNGVINNFLTQFYVLISIVVCSLRMHIIIQMRMLFFSIPRVHISLRAWHIHTITWKINGFELKQHID